MTDGDLISRDFQYEFRGLLFGSGTPIIVESMEGLLSLPGVESADIPNMSGNGSFMGRDRMPGRTITGSMFPTGTVGTGIESVLIDMEGAFQNTSAEYALVFKRPGRSKRQIIARCRRREIPTSYDLARGIGTATVEWYATDPRVYSNTEQLDTVTLAIGETSGSTDIYMNGNYEYGSSPILELDGPFTNPVISNTQDENKQMIINYTLTAGHTMVIDFKYKTIEVDGVSVYGPGVVLAGTRWWSLLPGINQIAVDRDNSAASGVMRVRWWDAYA